MIKNEMWRIRESNPGPAESLAGFLHRRPPLSPYRHNPKLAVWIIVTERKVRTVTDNVKRYFPCPRYFFPNDFLVLLEDPWEVFLYLWRVSSRRDTF